LSFTERNGSRIHLEVDSILRGALRAVKPLLCTVQVHPDSRRKGSGCGGHLRTGVPDWEARHCCDAQGSGQNSARCWIRSSRTARRVTTGVVTSPSETMTSDSSPSSSATTIRKGPG